MPARRKPTLLTQGEPRLLSNAEARTTFTQAEAALDTETLAGADYALATRSGCSARPTSTTASSAASTPNNGAARVPPNAHIVPTIGDVPVAKWRVERSRKVMKKGTKTIFSTCGREAMRGQMATMRKRAWRLGWLARCVDPLDGLEIARDERWHRAPGSRRNDPGNAWPEAIDHRNLRHYAATKWFHEELGESWEVVALCRGDKLTTVRNDYVRAGEDAILESAYKLANRQAGTARRVHLRSNA